MVNLNNGKVKPFLYSFITLRPERFGALLYNPYLGMEEELDYIETFLIQLCNGRNSINQITQVTKTRFGFSDQNAHERLIKTLTRLSNLFAIGIRNGEESTRPYVPDTPIFTENAPLLSAPKNIIWDITYACNLNCQHCLTSSGKPQVNELNTRDAFKLIDKLAASKILSISLCGGEPFLRQDIFELIRYITSRNMRVEIATNGMELSEETLQSLNTLPVFQVQVSIDGIGDEHDNFRGKKGAFETACRTVRLLHDRGIATSLSTTVTHQNINSIKKIIELAIELGCNGYKAIPFIPIGRGQKNAQQLKLSLLEHYLMSKTIIEERKRLDNKLIISTESSFACLFELPPIEKVEDGPMGCSAGYDTLSIGADGTAYPCPFLREFPLGNLRDTLLKTIWIEHPLLNLLRNIKKQQMTEPCKTCSYSPASCRGGCRAMAYIEHGNLYASDPTCFQSLLLS
jgi:radical SAM protein with 4Fe4S-binding SPASM domain